MSWKFPVSYHLKCNTSTVDVTSVCFHLVNSQSPLFGFEKSSPLSCLNRFFIWSMHYQFPPLCYPYIFPSLSHPLSPSYRCMSTYASLKIATDLEAGIDLLHFAFKTFSVTFYFQIDREKWTLSSGRRTSIQPFAGKYCLKFQLSGFFVEISFDGKPRIGPWKVLANGWSPVWLIYI